MIGYIRGKVLEAAPDSLLVDVGGVGYELAIPLTTFSEVERADKSEAVGLFVHTHVRADAIELFGFWTRGERRLFELLIAVSGIGPRLGRVILSGMPPEELAGAIRSEDASRLATIPGIGKKTAQRMVMELKDKVEDLAGANDERASAPGDDLLQALVNLGYRSGDAERALAKARVDLPDADFEGLLRASLKLLSRA